MANHKRITSLAWAILLLNRVAAPAAVPDGKGLGNLTYTQSQVGKTLSLIINREGHGWVAMHRGYLLVLWSKDSGKGMGGISFVDVSDPRALKTIHTTDNTETHQLREPHGWGLRGDIACLQAADGMNFWDFSDVTAPKLVSYPKLPGISNSDYDLGLWWTHWQGGYAYGSGSGNGLYIVDARDPANPRYVKRLPTSQTGGFRLGPLFAIGNLLVISSADVGGISTLDIGDPENPKLLATHKEGFSYASMVNGGRIIMAGTGATDGYTLIYDISNPTRISPVGRSSTKLNRGGYCGVADGHSFCGFSEAGFAKVDLSKPDFPVVQRGTSNLPGRDEDFAVPLGNLVFAGNDHPGQGSSLIPHQTAPDTKGPEVNMVVPADGAVNQPLTSRVGITLTDAVVGATITPGNFTIRPLGGAPLEGWYANQSAIINFTPKEPLRANTTYEVIVRAGGVTDYVGNMSTQAFRSAFSTGATVAIAPVLSSQAARPRSEPLRFRPSTVLFPYRLPGREEVRIEVLGRQVVPWKAAGSAAMPPLLPAVE